MQWERPQAVFARKALTAQGWQRDVLVTVDAGGMIARVDAAANPAIGTPSFDLLLPGIANTHSHAFQRAMAGLTERASKAGEDNFWSWRNVMYDFALKLAPEQVEIIARALYIELLRHGFTGVGEFHYLHHDTGGKPYAMATEMSGRVIAAAQSTGIHLTHLPVLYETANFGGVAASDKQRRFVHTADSYLKLLEALRPHCAGEVSLGIAPHSLRAVRPQSLTTVLGALAGLGMGDCPVHIHIAEQEKEVADCMAWSGQRPVEWLLGHVPVDKRWCLVHATHMTISETRRLAASGAVAGLCPTTEANLGDGIFPAELYVNAGGAFGIGTDSHIGISPWEELKLMEYAQRLSLQKRTVLCDAQQSVGRTLFEKAAAGGARALGLRGGCIAAGYRADLMALSMHAPLLAGKEGDSLLDSLIFALAPAVTDVFVAGKRVIAHGQHPLEEASAIDLQKVMQQLRN